MKYNQIYMDLKVQLENMTASGHYPDGLEYCDIPEWTEKEEVVADPCEICGKDNSVCDCQQL